MSELEQPKPENANRLQRTPVPAPNKSRILELVDFAQSDTSGEQREIEFGNVPNYQAQDINFKTGIRINGSVKTISTEAIIHTFKRHGDEVEESKRGQKGIVTGDFDYIPQILSQPDEVRNGGKNSRGQDSLVFIRTIKKITYHVVMCVKSKKGEISFSTMYAKK